MGGGAETNIPAREGVREGFFVIWGYGEAAGPGPIPRGVNKEKWSKLQQRVLADQTAWGEE